MSEKQLKILFVTYVSQKESYMQQNFQLHYDLGYASDYMYKVLKQITCRNRPDKIFTALYTVTSMLGKVASSRLTFTKINKEVNSILIRLIKLRTNIEIP